MLPYWFLFLCATLLVLSNLRPMPGGRRAKNWPFNWQLMFILLVLMIGLRHKVGGDWASYQDYLEETASQTLVEALLSKGEPGYGLLNWIAAHWGGGVYLVNTACAVLFSWGLIVFCRAQPRPWLALVVAIPYLVTVVAMGYSRQGVAIGISMIGLIALTEGKMIRFLFWVAIAASFHKSAVVLIPLAALANTTRPILTALGVGLFSVGIFVVFLQEMVNTLITNYVYDEMESSGAAIRVTMNALPALLFLIFRQRFKLAAGEGSIWLWMTLMALGFIPLLIVSPSSTAVDRIALYWIPIQLFVWSRMPDALGRPGGRNSVWAYSMVLYSATVLFVWLVFATHSIYWLPYKFYPWEVMWASL